MVNLITPRQESFLARLVAERVVSPNTESFLEALRNEYRKRKATSAAASTVISMLLEEPMRSTDPEPGIYVDEIGNLLRCYLGQNSGRMLVKHITVDADGTVEYTYLGRADKVLGGCRRLSREEVAERTLSYGARSCFICGRLLTDPESVDRGVGPVCWGEYGS